MKSGMISFLGIACAVLALPAAADEVLASNNRSIETPTLKMSGDKSEWYREFTTDTARDAAPVWQAEPTDDYSFIFDATRRWRLNLDMMKRSTESPLPREEMQAGATFRITPRLSVGGEVSVGAKEIDRSVEWEESDVEAGVRFKSAFKF